MPLNNTIKMNYSPEDEIEDDFFLESDIMGGEFDY